MDRGMKYTLPTVCYPRVYYFLKRLKHFMPRFQRIIDAGQLKDCTPSGQLQLKEINIDNMCVDEEVDVYVFADDTLKAPEAEALIVQNVLSETADKALKTSDEGTVDVKDEPNDETKTVLKTADEGTVDVKDEPSDETKTVLKTADEGTVDVKDEPSDGTKTVLKTADEGTVDVKDEPNDETKTVLKTADEGTVDVKDEPSDETKTVLKTSDEETVDVKDDPSDETKTLLKTADEETVDVKDEPSDGTKTVLKTADEGTVDVKDEPNDETKTVLKTSDEETVDVKDEPNDETKTVLKTADEGTVDVKDEPSDGTKTVLKTSDEETVDVKDEPNDETKTVLKTADEGTVDVKDEPNDETKTVLKTADEGTVDVKDEPSDGTKTVLKTADEGTVDVKDEPNDETKTVLKTADEGTVDVKDEPSDETKTVLKTSDEETVDVKDDPSDETKTLLKTADEETVDVKDEPSDGTKTVLKTADEGTVDVKDEPSDETKTVLKTSDEETVDVKDDPSDETQTLLKTADEETVDVKDEPSDGTKTVLKTSDEETVDLKDQSADNTETALNQSFEKSDTIFKPTGEKTFIQEQPITAVVASFMERSTSWSAFISESQVLSPSQCSMAVCVIRDQQHFNQVCNKISSLTEQQKSSIILHMHTDGRNFIFHQEKSEFSLCRPDEKIKNANKLNRVLQKCFEAKAIAFIEKILRFLDPFVPKSKRPLDWLAFSTTLSVSLKNGLKSGDILSDLLKNEEEGRTDVPVSDSSTQVNVEDKNSNFHKRLAPYVYYTVKCSLVEGLARHFGLRQQLALKLMEPEYFDLEGKVTEICQRYLWNDWTTDETIQDSITYIFKVDEEKWLTVESSSARSITGLVSDAKSYMDKKAAILDLIMRLQFELHGLLQQTDVPHNVVIPKIPDPLPLDLQLKLLKIPAVESCGHKYGQLVFHVSSPLDPGEEEEIRCLLRRYRYPHGYAVEEIGRVQPQVGGDKIGQGHELRFEAECGDVQCFLGSIGCFIEIRSAHEGLSGIHLLTCAHCCEGGRNRVKLIYRDNELHLGNVSMRLEGDYFLDAAVVRVKHDHSFKCLKELKRSYGEVVEHWDFYGEQLKCRQSVHKHGASTEFTQGVVVSIDNMLKKDADFKKRVGSTHGIRARNLDPTYSILIEPSADIPDLPTPGEIDLTPKPFSVKGDSGSVVCLDSLEDTQMVHVGALLCGALTVEEEGRPDCSRYICSYASIMHQLKAILEAANDCTILSVCRREVP